MNTFLKQCGTLLTRLMCIKGTLEGEERKKEKKKIVKEIMTENLANIKNIHLHSSAAQFQEETKRFLHTGKSW